MRIPPIARRSTLIACVLLGLFVLTPGAIAQGVWRVAGTMNGWATADDAWALTEEGDTLVLERELPRGTHRFKFVRDGDWANGHLGGAGDGTLEQPGRDLILEVRAGGVYRIELDPRARSWSWAPARITEPVLVAVVRGWPTVNQAFQIDLSRSLLADPNARVRPEAEVLEGKARVQRSGDRSLLVTPGSTGRLVIDVSLGDEPTLRQRVSIHVDEAWSLDVVLLSERQRIAVRTPMEPAAPGVLRGLVWAKHDGTLNTLRVVRGRDAVLEIPAPVQLGAGRYVVEVRDGVVTMGEPEGDLPGYLLPGGWTEFTFTPASGQPAPERVFLSGSFNRWADEGATDAHEMASVATGSFRTLIDLPLGEHRYGYLLDGERFVPDANNPDTVRNASDELVSLVVIGPKPNDYPLPRPNNLNLDAFRHDPLLANDFTPISRGLGLADISFTTLPDDARGASVLVDVKREDGSVERVSVACRRDRDGAGFDRYTARVMSGTGALTYAIALSDGDAAHVTDDYTVRIPPDPLMIPDWAKGAVWYQIFTERFRNGNPLNDPNGPGTYQMAWTADWYSVAKEEYAAYRERFDHPEGVPLEERAGGDLFHVVWDRRFGGDLQGVVEKLDYLRDLGVTALYFNPVFEGTSMHKYDATDFRHIDDNFGTPKEAGRVPSEFEWPSDPTQELDSPARRAWTAADRYFIDVLLPEAKRRGMRVVIDGVFNHTGRDHFAFQDVLEKGNRSEFADWFYTEFAADGSLESWRAWDGPSGWLPKFRQQPNGDLVQPVKDHIFAITERWMDPNGDGDPSDGIDGWRLDVPLDVGLPFWEDWRTLVKSKNPDAIIIAEIWSDARRHLRGEHFDTQMHYPFAMPVLDWLAIKPGMRSDELADELAQAFDEAEQTLLIHQNLFASHDTDRYVSMLYNPGRDYDQQNRVQDGDAYKDTKPDARAYELSLLGVAIQTTYLGAPMVYYGDELGMWGADDPTDRKPMAWPDLGPFENPDDGPDLGIHRVYRAWLRLRQDPVVGPVLRFGDVEHLESGSADVFAFQRSLNDVTVRVVVNRGERAYPVRRLDREGLGPSRVEPRSAVYWVIPHDEMAPTR